MARSRLRRCMCLLQILQCSMPNPDAIFPILTVTHGPNVQFSTQTKLNTNQLKRGINVLC